MNHMTKNNAIVRINSDGVSCKEINQLADSMYEPHMIEMLWPFPTASSSIQDDVEYAERFLHYHENWTLFESQRRTFDLVQEESPVAIEQGPTYLVEIVNKNKAKIIRKYEPKEE